MSANELIEEAKKMIGDKISLSDTGEKLYKVVEETMNELDEAMVYLATNMALPKTVLEDYKVVLQSIKGNNFGQETYLDIAQIMTEVVQIMGELNSMDMTEITDAALILKRQFNMDTVEILSAVNEMMKTMGITASQAFDFLAAGSQNQLNINGDLAKTVEKNCSLWNETGLSLEQIFTILDNGYNAGARELSGITGYVKEFQDSLINGEIEKMIGSFSIETQSLFDSWKNGDGLANNIFYSMISDLENMEDRQQQLALASRIWSSGSSEDAMRVLLSLNDINDAYDNLDGACHCLRRTVPGFEQM